MFDEINFLTEKTQLDKIIRSAGQNIQVVIPVNGGATVKNTRAIIAPLRYKNKIYLEGVVEKIGYVDERHYLYIGTSDVNFQGMPLSTYIVAHDKNFLVKACEPVYLGDDILYVWAILQTRHQGDNEWVI